MFKTGKTSAELDIWIINNNVFEGTDHFSTEIQPPSYVIKGNPINATVLIIDRDGKFESIVVYLKV